VNAEYQNIKWQTTTDSTLWKKTLLEKQTHPSRFSHAANYKKMKMASDQFVEWKDEYSVGIDSIDQQHKKLLNLINQLQTATILILNIRAPNQIK